MDTTINNLPIGFIGMLVPRKGNAEPSNCQELFRERTRQKSNLLIETSEFLVALAYDGSIEVAVDDNNEIQLFLHGEIVTNDSGHNSAASELLKIYRADGLPGLSRKIHGSCAVLLIDTRSNTIACITDRINSRKLFYSRENNIHWISTSLRDHPSGKVDPAGVASYLINRFLYAGRTMFSGVSILERSSVHLFLPGGIHSETYWHYDFEASYRRKDIKESEFIAQLSELLEQAIERRIPGHNGNAFCSLSGGLDSRMVISLLNDHLEDKSRLSALSYGSESDNDVIVAKSVAGKLGIKHRFASFDGSLPELVRLNGELCEGLVFFYTQGLSGTIQLIEDHSAHDVLFLGDECFGWGDMPLSSFDDVLQKGIGIRSPVAIPEYYSYVSHQREEIQETLSRDNRDLRERCASCENLHDHKDFLYLDQRLANMILPWREFHAGRFIKMSNCLLDYDILDFMKTVPTVLRLDKKLFRKTMQKMYPELDTIPYARSGGINNDRIHSLLKKQYIALMELVSNYESRLDEVIPPELIKISLLEAVQRQRFGAFSKIPFLGDIIDKLHRKYLAGKWYRSPYFMRNSNRKHHGILSISPMQLEALISLRYFLRK